MSEAVSVALFDRFEDARKAADALLTWGLPQDKIAILTNNAGNHHPQALSNPSFGAPVREAENEAPSSVAAGAGIGAGLGGVMGFLVGALALAIPGVGPVLAVGSWVTIAGGAALGAVGGGIISSLQEHGIGKDDADLYAEGLRRGGTLVTAHVDSGDTERVAELFKSSRAIDIEKRGAAWKADGWVGFEPAAKPLSVGEVAAMQAVHGKAGHEAVHHHAIRHYFRPSEPGLAGISDERPHYGEELLNKR